MGKSFEGKVVLVTGANSGIGEAIAVAFENAGATVFGWTAAGGGGGSARSAPRHSLASRRCRQASGSERGSREPRA